MTKRLTVEQKARNAARRKLLQEEKSWEIYKRWQGENIENIRPGQEIRNFSEFRDIYNDLSVGRRLERIKYEVQYQVSYNTYRRLQKRLRETRDKEDVEEILASGEFTRKRSTQELADFIKEDINQFRDRMKLEHPTMTSKDLALLVSEYFFGS